MSTSTQAISVPLSGLGASVDVSSMVGAKTVVLTGTFRGSYVLYGSHVGGSLAPLFQFDSGGVEGVRRTFNGALAWVAVRSLASDASGVTASISGDDLPGDNTFATLGTLSPGASGPQPAYDLGTSNYQAGLNFILTGGLEGKLVVEGSSDGVRWNPLGQWSVDPSGPGLLGPSSPEFAPIFTEDLVRYVRLNVLGRVTSTVVVTVGGSESGGGGGSLGTLAQTYQAGSSSADQTLTIADARGGTVVFDASGVGFTSERAVEVLVAGGIGAGALREGGFVLGPQNVVIGLPTEIPVVNVIPSTGHSVYLGGPIAASGTVSQYQVAVGTSLSLTGYMPGSVLVGSSLLSNGPSNVVVGRSSSASGSGNGFTVVVGESSTSNFPNTVVVGRSSVANAAHASLLGGYLVGDGSMSVLAGYDNHAYNNYEVAVGQNLRTPVNGSGVGSGTVDSVSDAGGGSVTIHSSDIPSGLASGQTVDISNTTIYDGSYLVSNVTAGTFDVVAAWSVTATGTYTVSAADGYNVYVGSNLTGAVGTGNADTYQVVVGADSVVSGSNVVAVGRGVTVGASANYAIGLGYLANCGATGTIVVGSGASSTLQYAISVGSSATAGGEYAICVGYAAFVDALKVVVVGANASGHGESGVVVGPTNTANNKFDVLYGSTLTTPINGSGVASGTVDSVSDAGGGSVTIHSSDIPAGLAAGQAVVISGTTLYDGTRTVANVTAGTFDVVAVWSVSAAGTYVVRAAVGYNIYVGFNIQGAAGTGNADTYQVAVGTDIVMPANSTNTVAVGASVVVGANGGLGTKYAVAVGNGSKVEKNGAIAVGSLAFATDVSAIALGSSTVASGAGAIALGAGANAAAHQVVVGASTNGYSLFEVVSDLVGNPDLFKFESALGSNGDTGLYLLCKSTTAGTVALQQVTLGASAGGFSALQVANT